MIITLEDTLFGGEVTITNVTKVYDDKHKGLMVYRLKKDGSTTFCNYPMHIIVGALED